MKFTELKAFLDEKAAYYQSNAFIEEDPIQIPHGFSTKEDIEISAFLVATIAWGNRTSIIKNGKRMMDYMDQSPHAFILHHRPKDLLPLKHFVHRTFNGEDFIYFIQALQYIYRKHGGLEAVFAQYAQPDNLQEAIHALKTLFFQLPHPPRTTKHLSDPKKGSAAKRINMFLRWMVRPAHHGVDFGIWSQLHPRQLSCPLDVHSGNVARKLGLLTRKQNDAKALAELDIALRKIDAEDPVKYDFALFGLGAFEKF